MHGRPEEPPHALTSPTILLTPEPALWEHPAGGMAQANVYPGGHANPHCHPGRGGDVSIRLQGRGQQGHSMEVNGKRFRLLPGIIGRSSL